jgi:hypothetical protein
MVKEGWGRAEGHVGVVTATAMTTINSALLLEGALKILLRDARRQIADLHRKKNYPVVERAKHCQKNSKERPK